MSRKAFTLIELMIVIAIIGILAAIAVPQLRKVQNRARQAYEEAEQQAKQKTEPIVWNITEELKQDKIKTVAAEYNTVLLQDQATVMGITKTAAGIPEVTVIGNEAAKQINCKFRTLDYTAIGDRVYIYVLRSPLEFQTGL